jgi:hypothetical protein
MSYRFEGPAAVKSVANFTKSHGPHHKAAEVLYFYTSFLFNCFKHLLALKDEDQFSESPPPPFIQHPAYAMKSMGSWYPLHRRLGGPQSRSGYGGDKILHPCRESNPRCSATILSHPDSERRKEENKETQKEGMMRKEERRNETSNARKDKK